tara:strand:+ start:260 stop:451 length:192 start_codon:yes stop_codon:yes gene_type:complete
MNLENNAPEEEAYYNSESEGKEFDKDFWEEYNSQSEETFINTCEETFGKKNCHEKTYKEKTNS